MNLNRNRVLLLAFAVSFILPQVSCSRIESQEDGRAAVTVNVSVAGCERTRAAGDLIAGTTAESRINTVDIFVYRRSDGSFAGSVSRTISGTQTSASLEMRLPREVLDFYVVANGPDLSSVLSKASLLSSTSAYLDNGASSFVMTGHAEGVDASSVTEVPVVLERIADKVEILRVTKDFSNPVYQAKAVTLTDVRLVNVRKGVTLFDSVDPVPAQADASFHNPKSFESMAASMYGIPSLAMTVSASGTAFNRSLYFYPNASPEAAVITGSDYVTKLVLTFNVGGTVYRYPMGLPQAAGVSGRNKIYRINNFALNITGNPESDSPNKYISNVTATVSLDILDWNDDGQSDSSWVPVYSTEFVVTGVSEGDFATTSGTVTGGVLSRRVTMFGGEAVAWTMDMTQDGGTTWTSTFPSWLTPSATSGDGDPDGPEAVTFTYNFTGLVKPAVTEVKVRFTQDGTGTQLTYKIFEPGGIEGEPIIWDD